jgi:Tfp pilus assembly protein PilV
VRRDQQGTTLIEVLVVAALLALTAIPVMMAFTQSEASRVSSYRYSQAVFLAESVVERFRATTPGSRPSDSTGVSDPEYPGFTYDLSTRPRPSGYLGLTQVTVIVHWTLTGRARSYQVVTWID